MVPLKEPAAFRSFRVFGLTVASCRVLPNNKLFEFCNAQPLSAVPRPVLVSPPMLRARRWLAGLMVVVFAAVEMYAAAPQLHVHLQAGVQGDVQQQGLSITKRSSGRNAIPNDCLACRTFSLATALISWTGVTPPGLNQTLTLSAPAVFAASGFHDDARGRAPPTC